jgi:hypothetical protein
VIRDGPSAPKSRELTAVGYKLGNVRFATLYNTAPASAADGYSSARDLLRFGAFMLKVPELGSMGSSSRGSQDFRYSDGWLILGAASNEALIADGEVDGGGAILILLPKERTAVTVLSNRGTDSDDLIDQVALTVAKQYQPGLDKAWDLALNSSGAEPPVSPRPFVGRWAGKLYRATRLASKGLADSYTLMTNECYP